MAKYFLLEKILRRLVIEAELIAIVKVWKVRGKVVRLYDDAVLLSQAAEQA